MPSTYSSRLRFELIGAGEQSGTWGTTTNTNLGTLIEEAIAGVSAVAMTDANYTLTASNGSSDEARRAVLQVTGTLTANRNVIVPTSTKTYIVYNNTTGGFALTFKTSAGSGIAVANGKKTILYCDGTNVVDAINSLPSGTTVGDVAIATTTSAQTLSNKTIDNSNTVTLKDTLFTVQDDGDATKQARFQASGITAGQTRVMTIPDTDLTLVGTAATQTLTNKTLTSPTINTPTITVLDNALTIQDNADVTKQAVFQASGITTGQTRTLTIPDASTTLVGTDATQTLSNKTLGNTTTFETKDSLFLLQDESDSTKKLAFQLSGITTGNTRTLTIPDASGTISTITAAAQSDMESASSTTLATTPGRQHFHPGHPKAWINFAGASAPTIAASYGVSSLDDDGVGLFGVNMSITMSSTSYALAAYCESVALNVATIICRNTNQAAKSTTAFDIRCTRTDVSSNSDSADIGVVVTGDL